MASGAATPGITIPKRAPLVEVKSPRDALIAGVSPYAVLNNRAVLQHIGSRESVNTLRVYIAICGHVNRRTGLANPSQGRLAALLGITRETVNRAIARLVKRQLIKIDHKRPAPGGRGSLLFIRVLFADADMTSADIQSIASYPQAPSVSPARTQANSPASVTAIRTGNRLCDTPHESEHSPYVTPTVGSHMRHLASHELLEHKNLMDKLENADAVIRQWLAYAWKHGQHKPIADEQDLATAHALVAKGVTLGQLERAVIQDPEADELAPIVRSLLA